jgi:hypothetical protein
MATLDELADERGTYAVRITFADEDGAAVVPNSGLTWTLTDALGTVVNSRTGVALTSASTVTVVLSGADLALNSSYEGRRRVLLVQGTYSGDLGSNLPIKQEFEFSIRDLVAVT